MKIYNFLHKSFLIFSIVTGLGLIASLSSCSDDDLRSPGKGGEDSGNQKMVCLPIGLAVDYGDASTRATGDLVNGSIIEHGIDTTANENFVIFFDAQNHVKYIKPLFISDQLNEKITQPSPGSEYTVFGVTYVPFDDVKAENQNRLTSILVVVNGGKIYKKFYDEIYIKAGDKDEVKSGITMQKILDLKWLNPFIPESADEGDGHENDEDVDAAGQESEAQASPTIVDDGPIGINSRGFYTMTNSAYIYVKNAGEEDDQDANDGQAGNGGQNGNEDSNDKDEPVIDGPKYEDGQLMTVVKLDQRFFYESIDDFLKNDQKPTATVYLERMVAKFMAPILLTDVYGSDRFFRPSDKIPHIIIYGWNGKDLTAKETDWRIHLLGWAINAYETESYIFKHIPTGRTDYKDWPFTIWNNSREHRSYWSEDPHYDNTSHFYPSQYRKAADVNATISLSAGISKNYTPALKYYNFSQIVWNDSVVAPENTYRPDMDWGMDHRENELAGSHLILAGELYLKGQPGGIYLPDFGPVPHLYSDRIQRYYLSEKDWFKMFVKEFNNSLSTQEIMSFHVYDWDNPDNKENTQYQTIPTGKCKLYYNDQVLEDFAVIDQLFDEVGSFSYPANVRQGDGRLIPWIEHKRGEKGLHVRTPEGKPLEFYQLDSKETDLSDNGNWTDDMYKSLFYEWFGPIDHFKGGRMYYSGAIQHQNGNLDNYTTYYGTVRNHCYRFRITSINGIGTPVDDELQPIIPDNYGYKSQMSVQFDIIKWHNKTQLDIVLQ